MCRRFRSLTGSEPHPDYGGWAKFLRTCEVRDAARGVTFYGSENCNYVVFPCRTIVQNYGYHGRALMNRVRKEGPTRVLNDLREKLRQLQELLQST